MSRLSKNEKGRRTGSNLRGNPLLAYRTKLLAKQNRAYGSLARELQRQRGKLFSKADVRVAAKIASEVNAEWRVASLTVGGNASRLETLKASARQKLDRKLAGALPSYRKWQALQRGHLRDLGKLAEVIHVEFPPDVTHIAWGDVVASDEWVDSQDFFAPFSHFASDTIDERDNLVSDHSFAIPDRGYVVNNLVFKQDEDTPAIIGFFGLIRPELASNQTSCGIRYTMPKSGRLQIIGSLQNYVSGVVCSIDDNFGFSSATLNVGVELFVALVRPFGVTYLPTTLLSIRLNSDGDDKSYAAPHLDTSVPYSIYAYSPETFEAGESVQIMVGSAVTIAAEADDMTNEVHANLEWRLDKITVAVI